MHSPWISRLLSGLGHEVIVAHARNVRLIGESRCKDDRLEAQTVARLARIATRRTKTLSNERTNLPPTGLLMEGVILDVRDQASAGLRSLLWFGICAQIVVHEVTHPHF